MTIPIHCQHWSTALINNIALLATDNHALLETRLQKMRGPNLATISICAHLRWQSIISDSYLTISLRIETWLHRGIVLNAQSLVQCLVPRPSPWAQDQPPRNEVTAHFGRLVTTMNSNSLKIPIYDKVSDAVEMKVQFASNILTPRRMH